MRRDHAELLNAHAGVDPIDAQLEQAQKMRNFAGRPGSPNRDILLGAIDAQARHAQ